MHVRQCLHAALCSLAYNHVIRRPRLRAASADALEALRSGYMTDQGNKEGR